MSLVLHLATAVATTPVPTPSPQVIKEVITNTVPVQVPAEVLQLAQVLAVAGAAIFVSLVHAVVERGRWSSLTNRVLVTGYTLLAALLTAALTGHLGTNVNDLQVLLTAFLTALGAALGNYNLVLKSIFSAFGFNLATGTTDKTEPPLSVLSTDKDPAQGVG